MPRQLLSDTELQRVYARSRGPVAFCDESHRVGPGAEVGFYTVTAVLYDRDQLVDARAALADVAGSRPWHTTEEFEAGRDGRIHRMLQAGAAGAEWGIVTVEAPVDGLDRHAYAAARRSCLQTLLPEVTRGADPVRVVVMDTLGDPRADGVDRRLAAELRGHRLIPPATLLRHADDRHEPLLWAPDVVGWAARRFLARDEPAWFGHVLDVSSVLDARTGTRLDVVQMHNSAAAAAAPAAPDGEAGLTPAEPGSARPPLLPCSWSRTALEVARRSAGRSMTDLLQQAGAARRPTRDPDAATGPVRGPTPPRQTPPTAVR